MTTVTHDLPVADMQRDERRQARRTEFRRTFSGEAVAGALAIGLAMTVVYELLILASWPRDVVVHLAMASIWPLVALAVLLALALVDATLGNSAWRHAARPLAVALAIVVGIELAWLAVADLVPARLRDREPRDKLDWMFSIATYAGIAVPLYYIARRARARQRQLRRAEAEEAEQARLLARQQLAAQLAQVDYELVIDVMRGARSLRQDAPLRAEACLDRLVDYLRAAQQRDGPNAQHLEHCVQALRECRLAAGRS